MIIIIIGLAMAGITAAVVIGAFLAPDLSCPNCGTTHLSRGKVCPDCGADMPELPKHKSGTLTKGFGARDAVTAVIVLGIAAFIWWLVL